MFKINDLQKNLTSGLLVSFIAMPLCIAISIASGFPVLSGLFTAIIGGILVSHISFSRLSIKGPAAGMIVVILDSVERLGAGDIMLGYKYTLAAIVLASIAQLITSFTKLPILMRKFPECIIRGMMMSIGLIVILKQLFILFSYKAPKVGLIELFLKLPAAFMGMETATFAIGIFTIILIFSWKKSFDNNKFFKLIPAHLIAIIFGSALAIYFNIAQNSHFLIPEMANPVTSLFLMIPASITDAIAFPDFSKFATFGFALSVFSIFAVGSLETILSAVAVDKLDLSHKTTDLKYDLRGVAIGNLICGLIGALPMITEIVRSSANIKYGATNKWSNFFHGAFLLMMITIFNPFLHFIPLCVLAGMLIMIGWTLVNFPLSIQIFKESKHHFATIISVIFFTLYIDLLVGIFAGIIVYFVFEKIHNHLTR